MRLAFALGLLLLVACLAFLPFALGQTGRDTQTDDEGPVALADVPNLVMEAAKKAVPDGTPTKAEMHTEDGRLLYEIEFDTPPGEVEVEVAADGSVLKIEADEEDKDGNGDEVEDEDEGKTSVALGDVPDVVMEAAKNAVPDGTPTEAEMEAEHGRVVYEIEFDTPCGGVEVEVAADGAVLEVEADEEGDDEGGDEVGDEDERETPVGLADVPDIVMEATKKAVPDGTPIEAEMATEDGRVLYKIQFDTPRGEVEVEVAADGTVLEVEADEDG